MDNGVTPSILDQRHLYSKLQVRLLVNNFFKIEKIQSDNFIEEEEEEVSSYMPSGVVFREILLKSHV